MAYFSNGTAGELFESAECGACIHNTGLTDPDAFGCPILALHFLYNYDQHEKGEPNKIAEMLKILIDDDKPLGEMCQMRSDKPVERSPFTPPPPPRSFPCKEGDCNNCGGKAWETPLAFQNCCCDCHLKETS